MKTAKVDKMMIARYDMDLTPRQALFNASKDAMRWNYELLVKDDKPVEYIRTVIHNIIEVAVIEAIDVWCFTDRQAIYPILPILSIEECRRVCNTRVLSKLGVWVESMLDLWHDMTDKQWESFVNQLIKKVV